MLSNAERCKLYRLRKRSALNKAAEESLNRLTESLKATSTETIDKEPSTSSNDEPIVRSERYSLMEDEDWRMRGSSIWTQAQERTGTRVKYKSRCRATTCQLVQLVKFMEKHPQLAMSHSRPFPGSDELWMELAEHINQFGPPKNYRQCKTTWRDLRKRAFAMMQRGRNKKNPTGRNLYGMAPRIISLITAAGGSVYKVKPDDDDDIILPSEGSASSSKAADSPTPVEQPTNTLGDETAVIKVERTTGDQLVIRVTDKLDSKTNVFNRFTINDGHFENNITVKEEVDRYGQDEEPEPMEPEPEVDTQDQSEEMFPPAEAILGDTDNIVEEKNSVIRDLNETLRKFLTEYKTRNALMRERIDLERARLQFDMEVYRTQQVEKRAAIAIQPQQTMQSQQTIHSQRPIQPQQILQTQQTIQTQQTLQAQQTIQSQPNIQPQKPQPPIPPEQTVQPQQTMRPQQTVQPQQTIKTEQATEKETPVQSQPSTSDSILGSVLSGVPIERQE